MFSPNQTLAIIACWKNVAEAKGRSANVWIACWDGPYEDLEVAFGIAQEVGTPEAWDEVSEKGLSLRREMRNGIGEEALIYTKIVALTDTISIALREAGKRGAHIIPPGRGELVQRIARLEGQVDEERRLQRLEQSVVSILDKVEAKLAESKHALVEEINLVKFDADPSAIISLIRDGLEALKHGIDLLSDRRLTEPLRRQALAAWYGGQKFIGEVRRRVSALRLAWPGKDILGFSDEDRPNFADDKPVDLAFDKARFMDIMASAVRPMTRGYIEALSRENNLDVDFFVKTELLEGARTHNLYGIDFNIPPKSSIEISRLIAEIAQQLQIGGEQICNMLRTRPIPLFTPLEFRRLFHALAIDQTLGRGIVDREIKFPYYLDLAARINRDGVMSSPYDIKFIVNHAVKDHNLARGFYLAVRDSHARSQRVLEDWLSIGASNSVTKST
jgi:hypothetical protein